MNWNIFERRVCLTTNPAEWQKAEVEFARVGLLLSKFQSIPDAGPHQSFNRSTHWILYEFYESGADSLLFLEDDCEFRDLDHLEQALSELPADWDIVYLGANILEAKPEKYSEHLYRVREAWTTHAIAYRRKVIPFLLENQPPFGAEMFDCWMSKELHRLNAYVVAPMVAYQRFHPSLIWGTEEDYTPIFEASDAKLCQPFS